MKITKVKDGCPIKFETEKITEEQLQNEYDFYMAESLICMLFKEDKISEDELRKISAKVLAKIVRTNVIKALL
jgi:uncharacterized metal-binding protein